MKWKKDMNLQEASDLVERFLNNKCSYPQEWNDFVEAKQTNRVVDAYRKRCYELDPEVNSPEPTDDGAVRELRSMIEMMRKEGIRK